jgi:hypothetical protein
MRLLWGLLLLAVSTVCAQDDGVYADFATSMGAFTCRLDYTNAPAQFYALSQVRYPSSTFAPRVLHVYQVDTTILRWLALRDDEVLVQECGEDIDKVSKALDSSGREGERLLEQVKHRNSSLTLRASECIEAIANFAEHTAANPNVGLRFLFTTTAEVGFPSPFEDRCPCIEVWEAIRSRTIPESEIDRRREGRRAQPGPAESISREGPWHCLMEKIIKS